MVEKMGGDEERRRPPTLRDVAALANVSVQTISRVINNKGEVRASTRQRVLEAIQQLGYQPNTLARSLVTSQSSVIGLIVPDISMSFYPEIARGVDDGAQEAGYSVVLCNAAGNADRELQALERLRGQRIAGLIVCNSRLSDDVLERAVTGLMPVVLVNRHLPNVSGTVIWTGYVDGSIQATNHLLDLGRRRIGYLGAADRNLFDVDKLLGYGTVLEQAGVSFDPDLIARSTLDFKGGFAAMTDLMSQSRSIDAVFAFNDHMAIGALRYAATHGIAVPGDIAVMGFGGSAISAMTTPSLSTIAVPLYDIGSTAIRELLKLIDSGGQEQEAVHAEPELVARASTTGREPPLDLAALPPVSPPGDE